MSPMTPIPASPSVRGTTRLAGILYLSLMPLGVFSFVVVPSVVVVRGDAAATARNIIAHEGLFRAAVIGHLLGLILIVFLLFALHRLLGVVHRGRAALLVALGLLCVAVSSVAEVHQLSAVGLLGGEGDGAFTSDQLRSRAAHSLEMHRSGVLVGQIFWGLYLVPLGALVHRSGFLPRWLAIPVLVAAAGYLFDSAAHLLAPGGATVSQYTAVAELFLPLWLTIRGVDAERRRGVAAAVTSGESGARQG